MFSFRHICGARK